MTPDSAPAASSGDRGGRQRFAFVPNTRPMWRTVPVLALLVASWLLWRWWVWGPADFDWAAVAVALTSLAVATPGVLWLHFSQARRTAAEAGHVELDDVRLEWVRPDGSLYLGLLWIEIERAIVDPHYFTVVLSLRNGGPGQLIGWMTDTGNPSTTVAIERFDALIAALSRNVPVEHFRPAHPEATSPLRQAERRQLRVGLGSALLAAALYGANRLVMARLGWDSGGVTAPIAIAVIGALFLARGLGLARSRTPLVSVAHHPAFTRSVLGTLALMAGANVVDVLASNLLRR